MNVVILVFRNVPEEKQAALIAQVESLIEAVGFRNDVPPWH